MQYWGFVPAVAEPCRCERNKCKSHQIHEDFSKFLALKTQQFAADRHQYNKYEHFNTKPKQSETTREIVEVPRPIETYTKPQPKIEIKVDTAAAQSKKQAKKDLYKTNEITRSSSEKQDKPAKNDIVITVE